MTILRSHQRLAFSFAENRPASLIAAGMGTGKSCVATKLRDHWAAHRTLILCPPTVRPVWRRELPRHSDQEVLAKILDGGSVRRRTAEADAACKAGGPVAIVANYEAASLHDPLRRWILDQKWDLVVLDESQRVMGESRTSQFCAALRTKAGRRLCLSGTPLTQDPCTVWAQARFLDPTVFGNDIALFKRCFENRYAVGCRKALAKLNDIWLREPGREPWSIPEEIMRGTINTGEYLERLGRIAIRIESDVLDLPPMTVENRTFKLSAKARALYDAVLGGNQEFLESGRWPDAAGSYAVTMRLQQITSGWLADRDGNAVPVDSGKAECLEDILTEAGGEPVVVFCRFIRDLEIVRETATKLLLRYGEISQGRKDGLTDMATMPDWCQVVGVIDTAGGAGVDLTRARIVVDYSPSWAPYIWDQKIARVYRPPQDRPVAVYQLVAEGTIDEEIHRAIKARKDVVKQVWRDLSRTTSPATLSPGVDNACCSPRYRSIPA